MTIEQAEAELIRVLDAKVAAGARMSVGYRCALTHLKEDQEQDLGSVANELFGWTRAQALSFMWAFDGRFDRTACREYPEHAALGDRIARRYGVR